MQCILLYYCNTYIIILLIICLIGLYAYPLKLQCGLTREGVNL